MNKQRKTEKLFSENLDRLLNGKAVKADAGADKDMLSALDFAAKIAEIKPSVSPEYRTRLKARLLEKLESREAAVKKNAGHVSIFRQPAWQAVAAVFMVVLVITIIWRAGVFNFSTTPQPTATTTVIPTTTSLPTATTPSIYMVGDLFGYTVQTDKTVYKPGEKVVINLTLVNISPQTLTVDKLPPIMSIMSSDTGKPVYTFSAGKDSFILAHGDTVQLSYSWDQVDFDNSPAATGTYYIELEDMEYQGQTLEFQQPQPVHFEISSQTTY